MNESMGARWKGVALVALLALAGSGSAATQLRGTEAPDFVLKSLSGKNLRLSEYRGEVVMLSFWATWCGDCRAQLTELAAMRDRYQEAGVELLAVSLDQNARQASEVTAEASYPVLHDAAGEVGRLYDVTKMPVMVLIDRGGVVREVFEGFRRGNEEQYLERVQALLRE
ncbi:MAG TPA: TlpA disulfide reductase family protein [Gammaproteobacteria bacterium]|nr:TlpA disulfide reductase family protein [Gammaproteobacteria bacterium]